MSDNKLDHISEEAIQLVLLKEQIDKLDGGWKKQLSENVKAWRRVSIQRPFQCVVGQGEARLVLHLLSKKFGSLCEEKIAKVNMMSVAELNILGERLLDAKTLEEVFL